MMLAEFVERAFVVLPFIGLLYFRLSISCAGLDDVVADLRMVPASMEDVAARCGFDGQGSFAHAGMLACAEWIYEDLDSHGIVDKLLMSPRCAGYTVRLTGHSKGAGTCAILSLMLKSKYPSLKCSCYCPPGCTVSADLAESCKEYLTSYILDHGKLSTRLCFAICDSSLIPCLLLQILFLACHWIR